MKVCDMDCFHCKYDDCINDEVKPARTYSAGQKWYRNESQKERYAKRKVAGLCVRCGKKPVWCGSIYCYEHWLYRKRYMAEYRSKKRGDNVPRSDRKALGLCWYCGKPYAKGFKICAECLSRRRKNNVKTNYI